MRYSWYFSFQRALKVGASRASTWCRGMGVCVQQRGGMSWGSVVERVKRWVRQAWQMMCSQARWAASWGGTSEVQVRHSTVAVAVAVAAAVAAAAAAAVGDGVWGWCISSLST